MAKELSFSLGIGATPLSEPEDLEMANELFRIYQALNVLASQLDTATGGLAAPAAERYAILASTASKEANMCRGYGYATVDLTAGEIVHFNSSGQLVKANATGTGAALKGQAAVLTNTITGDYAPLAFRGVLRLYAGLTAGAYYHLSVVAGGISISAPAAGNTLQYLGFALSASELYFCPEPRHSLT